MKFNSIIFKMMTPLIALTIFMVSVTLFLTQTYIKKVVEDIFIDLQVRHLKELYTSKMQNIISELKTAGVVITNSKEIRDFASSKEAAEGIIPDKVKQKLSEFKDAFKLDTVYVAHAKSGNYFNEEGFVKVVDTSDEESKWFLNTLRSKKLFLINADSDITGRLHIWLDGTVGDTDHPTALAGGGVDITDIFEIALEDFRKDNADVTIINDAGIVYAYSGDNKLLNVPLGESGLGKEKIEAIQDLKNSGGHLTWYTSKETVRDLLLIPIERLGWNIVIDFSKEEFLNSLSGIYDRIIIGGVILLLLLLLVGSMTFIYLVSRPLKKISSAVSEFDYRSDFNLADCRNMGYEFDMISKAFSKNSALLRKTIDEYRHNEELLKSIINAADDLIFYKDTSNRYLGGNSAYEKWLSKDINEIVGKSDNELYPSDIANYHINTDRQVIEQKRTILVEERFQKDAGNFVILQVKKSPFYDKDGHIIGIVVVARDMTMIKDMEQALINLNSTLEKRVEEKTVELQKTNDILEDHIADLEITNAKLMKARTQALQAAQARSNFITGISHELRTPLNAIINFTDQVIEDFDEMLDDKELQEDTRRFMHRVLVNSKHLLNLINDLLEFTKAEAGKIDYKIEKHDLNIIAKTAYNNTYSLLNGTDVKFNLQLCQNPIYAAVDSRRFLQILLNLLSNAIKFTKKGAIELRSFEADGFAITEIQDSGKGIPLDKQSIIFEPFIQVNNTDNGTGLGLGLVKRMCDDMGIEISFTSQENVGTTFRLKIRTEV